MTLKNSQEPLTSTYDCAMLDLDGVVYRGAHVIDKVPDVLRRARSLGMTLAFVTNNAARTPREVAAQLRDLGIEAADADVVTSAQAAAREVANRVPAGSAVLVVGGEGLEEALRERRLVPVFRCKDSPRAVVQGFHPDVGWRQLAEAAYALAADIPWVASNTDLSIPTASGIAPGNGTLVNAVATAIGRGPDAVAGKPHRPLFDETVLRVGASNPLVVGDRLDTDIEGANACGADSLLVLTGVTDFAALCCARPPQRPSYVATGLEGLLREHQAPTSDDGRWNAGGWTAQASDGKLAVSRRGADAEDGLRAAVAAAWSWYDEHPDAAEGALAVTDARAACETGSAGRAENAAGGAENAEESQR